MKLKLTFNKGDTLSPVLISLALVKVVRSIPIRQSIEIWSINMLLAYANDIVIIGNTRQEVETRTNNFIKTAKPMGLEVNQEKTKYLVITREIRDDSDLVVDNYTFQ